jgi:hypothetical protein
MRLRDISSGSIDPFRKFPPYERSGTDLLDSPLSKGQSDQ